MGGEWNILISKLKGFIKTTLSKELKTFKFFYSAREYKVNKAPISKDKSDNFLISKILTK